MDILIDAFTWLLFCIQKVQHDYALVFFFPCGPKSDMEILKSMQKQEYFYAFLLAIS